MSKNISGLKKRNEELSAQKEAALKKALDKLHRSGIKFSIAQLCKEAGVSRQFLHNHKDLLDLVYKYTSTTSRSGTRNKDSIETHISMLKATIREKDREIARVKKEYECNYKKKYDEALLKIKELEMQLEEAYSMNLPTTL